MNHFMLIIGAIPNEARLANQFRLVRLSSLLSLFLHFDGLAARSLYRPSHGLNRFAWTSDIPFFFPFLEIRNLF